MIRKFIFLICIALFSIMVYSQAPSKFSYQAVLRDNAGEIVANQSVAIRLSILSGSTTGTAVYSERHTPTTNSYGLVTITVGAGSSPAGDFEAIDWGDGAKYLKVEVDVEGGTSYTNLGVMQLLSVPYALYAKNSETAATGGNWLKVDDDIYYNSGNVGIGSDKPLSKLEVKADPDAGVNDPLFEVINANNDTVFAVYPDGVKVFVNSESKGKVGGFAVSGRTAGKATEEDYLRITADSTRIYVNESIPGKGKVGGFAVSGRTAGKSGLNDYLIMNNDSTRIYVNDGTGTKGKVGGFAVSGRTAGKGATNNYFVTTADSTRIYVQDDPNGEYKGGFAVAGINTQGKTSTGNYLDITPDNSFIGQDAGKSNTTGFRNAFMGYQAGTNNTEGYDNVFIGNESGLQNTTGKRNIFIGTKSGEENTKGWQNISIGLQSGQNLQSGNKNVFIGTVAGASNVDGDDNVFIGNFAGNKSTGSSNVYIGRTTGMNNTIGAGNVYIGEQAGRYNEEGSGNVFIGKGAGANETGSNRLYISNSSLHFPLVYGEFDNGLVEVHGSMTIWNLLRLLPLSSYPASPVEGDIFYDANSHSIKFYNGTEWMELAATATSEMPPEITTDSIPELNILGTSCEVYGTIVSEGSSPIIEAGVCYSEVPFFNFAIMYDSIQIPSPGLGSFNITFTGLPQYQDVYIRTFARNSEGISMGEMIKITMPASFEKPSIESGSVLNITQTTAVGSGNVTKPGGTALSAVGVCWNTSPGPTIDDNFTSESVKLGEFTSNITGLTLGTTYYARVYATNANGTSYGDEIIFNTASDVTTVTDGDGNVYNIVQIGTQTWIQENLKSTKYSNGDDIPNVTDSASWTELLSGGFCWYENDSTSYHATYGALYNYYAVEDSRNICPAGWHVPTKDDWQDLVDYVGGEEVAGGKLKEAGTTHWTSDPGADNASGFTALPGGDRYDISNFEGMGIYGLWWSSTSASTDNAWMRYIMHSRLSMEEAEAPEVSGLSVRCIKD